MITLFVTYLMADSDPGQWGWLAGIAGGMLGTLVSAADALTRIMHTPGPEESRDKRNVTRPQDFRAPASPEPPKQPALRRTPAKLPVRRGQEAIGPREGSAGTGWGAPRLTDPIKGSDPLISQGV